MSDETVLTDTQPTADTSTQDTAGAASAEKTDESTLLGKEAEAGKDGKSADDAAKSDTKTGEGTEDKNKNETPEQKVEREKQEAAANVIPEKYDIKVPDGMTIDQALLDKVTPIFKEAKITQGVAQKLADTLGAHTTQQVEANKKAAIDFYEGTVKTWKADTIKELGADYEKQMAFAAKAIDHSKIPGLREMANMTGVGNHPAFVKFAIWAGKLVSQDSLADSGNKMRPVDNDQARGEILFPSSKK